MDTLFRSSDPAPTVETAPEPERSNVGYQEDSSDIQPIEAKESPQAILNALGIDDMVRNLSAEDQSNLAEAKDYVTSLMKQKGVAPTQTAYKRFLGELMETLEIDKDAEPQYILDKIGGLARSWKGIGFIKDPAERRSLFMKLARQTDAKGMDNLIYDEMNKRKIWQ